MGNKIDERSKFEGGYLYVKTDKPYYYKGDTVYGKIYIRVEVPMNANVLEIDIKGKEKCSHYYTTRRKKRTVHHHPKMTRKYFEYKATCF